jgi:hypothetical protein
MPTRAIRVAATGFVGFFATLGVLDTPAAAVLAWCVLGLTVGTVAAIVPRRRTRVPHLRTGALTAAGFVAVSLTVTGMLATLGGGLTASLLAVFALAALVTALRRRPPRRRLGPDADDVIAAVTLPPPARPVAELSTDELCTAWRRSYFQLLVARDAPARRSTVQRRQDYLDEIERRDRRGFVRWLDSGARAGGDPAPYLTTKR